MSFMYYALYILAGVFIGPGLLFVYGAAHPTAAVIGALSIVAGILIAGITALHQKLSELKDYLHHFRA